ncbi:hypothetical protein V6N11_071768 [Hibiscus sabdariffa]|uniref:Retrotransposon gag domain-containing protein n=1 Tax=Hibiscus sabdariffa TaxID=183260 RepID=A0ABR2U116_9ROSI
MAHRGNNGQDQIDEHDPPRQDPPTPAGRAIVPPIPQNNQQQPVRTVCDYLAEDLEGLNPPAKAWLNNLPPGSLQSWTELCRNFLAKFSYTNMFDNLRNQITSFRQEDDEAKHEAWEHYIDLFRCCPMNGLPKWTQESIFYNSINTPTRMMLDTSANGTLLDKPPRESLEILEELAQNDYQNPTTRRGNTSMMPQSVGRPQNQAATLGTSTKQSRCNAKVLGNTSCGFPSDTKVAKGATHEQCKAIATRSAKILEPTNKQRGIAVVHTKTSTVTDTPATTDIPTKADEVHIEPIETREVGSTVEASQPEQIRSDKLEEIRPPSPFPQSLKKQKQDYQFKKFFDILKQVHINLPLVEALHQIPNYAKFLKDIVSRKRRIREFEIVAATETCLALMHNKVPAKKTDPGSFTIQCSIGDNYSTKALCDPGASINLMPKSVFQKLGIGEAKPTTVMLQLTDHSFVQPEGKIKDILVRINKFIFPADFLILDCEADEHTSIILGIPFLATS